MVTIPLLASHPVYHLPPSYHWATDHFHKFPIISWFPSHCWHLSILPSVPLPTTATILPLGHWPLPQHYHCTQPSHCWRHLTPSTTHHCHHSTTGPLPLPNIIEVHHPTVLLLAGISPNVQPPWTTSHRERGGGYSTFISVWVCGRKGRK